MMQSLKNARILLVSLPVLLLLFLAGCWSSNEIEDLGLSIGLAIDEGIESQIEKELKEYGGEYPKGDFITLTYQYANQQSTKSASTGGGIQLKPYENISETGDSVHQMTREFSLRRNNPMFSPHLKVIVIGEDLASKHSLEQLLDQFFRDNEIRPSCLVLISKGQASKTLESKDTVEIPSFRLLGISANEYKTTRILPPISLAKIEGTMHSCNSFLLQNVISTNGEVKFAGAAIIEGKTKKLLGFFNEDELDGLTWLTGKGKGGIVKSLDQETGQPIMYEVTSMNSKIIPHVNGNNITFEVNIESTGRISENWVVSKKLSKQAFLKFSERSTKEEVNRLVNLALNKMQNDYKVDVADFGNQLRIKHPKLWEKRKKDWDKTFSEITIKYNVNISITDFGFKDYNK
jgi:spore germination protein